MKKLDDYLQENDINLLEVSEEVWLYIQNLPFKRTVGVDNNDSEQLKLLKKDLRDKVFPESDIYHSFLVRLVETCLSLIKEKEVIKDQDKNQWVLKKR